MKKNVLILLLVPFLCFSQLQIGDDIDGETAFDRSGGTISLSSDGSIIAIGAPLSSGNGLYSGNVRIYENVSGNWVQLGQDIDGEFEEDQFGFSISLSNNGNVVAIGAPFNNGNGDNSGHVRVYENLSGTWTQIGNDIEGESIGDQSGFSVSLSGDGTIVAIGEIGNSDNEESSGQVRVFENQLGNWIQIGQDINGENFGDTSGTDISLSNNGNIVAISASRNSDNGSWSGHVRIYEYQSSNWLQIGQDINGEAADDRSGQSISLSNDGSIIAIGASFNDGNGENSGHVRVYENQSGIWNQLGNDIDGEATSDFSGVSVSLSGDGNLLAIGANQNDGNGVRSGHVRIYKNQTGTWTQLGSDIDGESAYDHSGNDVELSQNGSTVAIGAIFNNDNGSDSGHTRVFDLSALLSVVEFTLFDFELFPNPTNEQFSIQIKNDQVLDQVNIYDNLGQLIRTSQQTTIKTTNLSAGIYYVQVITTKGECTKKLILE